MSSVPTENRVQLLADELSGHVLVPGEGRQREGWDGASLGRKLSSDAAHERKSVFVRHSDVAHQNVRSKPLEGLEASPCRRRGLDQPAVLPDHFGQQLAPVPGEQRDGCNRNQ